eukprot:COSAG01_NODE_20784_length_935_cov_2.427033_1_plen_47_part_10
MEVESISESISVTLAVAITSRMRRCEGRHDRRQPALDQRRRQLRRRE